MAIDTPARIAILGGGPTGLEAALYARYLGYEVALFERGRVAEHLLQWGHVRLFSPFRLNRSPLGLAALSAQDPAWQPPGDDSMMTGRELAETYFLPLAASDLLDGSIQTATEVLAIGRSKWLKGDHVGQKDRGRGSFRILLRDAQGERTAKADVVIDATGTFGNHNWLGRGGIPAVGELGLSQHIDYGLSDVLGSDRAKFADRRLLLIGGGYSAATNVVALAELAKTAPRTHVTWITRPGPNDASDGPIPRIPADRLAERDQLARRANELAAGQHPNVTHSAGMWVNRVIPSPDGGLVAYLTGSRREKLAVDRIIANVGYRPDATLYGELQVHECYATGGPMKLAAALSGPVKLAAALMGSRSADCLDLESCGPETLVHPEPNFFILGAKSYGRGSRYLMSLGLEQIREVFSLVFGRADLNLYAAPRNDRS